MSLNKPSNELLLDLINSANQTDLSFTNIDFEQPQVLSDDTSNKNTALNINALPRQGYTGAVTVKYNRIGLSELSEIASNDLTIPVEGTAEDLIDSLNTRFQLGLQLSSDIVDNFILDDLGYAPTTIIVQATNESYAFTGEIEVDVSWVSTDLNSVITTYGLNGLSFIPSTILEGNVELLYSFTNTPVVSRLMRGVYIDGKIIIVGLDNNNAQRTKLIDVSTGNVENHVAVSGVAAEHQVFFHPDTGSSYRIVEATGNTVRVQHMNEDFTYASQVTIANSKAPSLVYYPEGLIHDNKIYIFNVGASNTKYVQRTYALCYDIALNSWSNIPHPYDLDGITIPYSSSFTVLGDYIYRFGGRLYTGSNSAIDAHPTDKCYRYHIPTNTLEPIANLPTPRWFHSFVNSVTHKGEIYIVGGVDVASGSSAPPASNEVLWYDHIQDRFEVIGEIPFPNGVSGTVLVSDGDNVYMAYGNRQSGGDAINAMYRIT